jgi:hypothetical protein
MAREIDEGSTFFCRATAAKLPCFITSTNILTDSKSIRAPVA